MTVHNTQKFNSYFTFTYVRFYAGFYCFAKNE